MNSNVKILGGLGSLFLVLSFIPYLGAVLGIAGLILLIVAVKQFADGEGRGEIFSVFLKGILVSIIGGIVGAVIMFAGFASAATGDSGALGWFIGGIGGLIVYASSVYGNYYIKQAFEEIALLTGNTLFAWAGKLLFWGAILMIILIGSLVVWVGWILSAVAFFTTEEKKNGSVVESSGQSVE